MENENIISRTGYQQNNKSKAGTMFTQNSEPIFLQITGFCLTACQIYIHVPISSGDELTNTNIIGFEVFKGSTK